MVEGSARGVESGFVLGVNYRGLNNFNRVLWKKFFFYHNEGPPK